MHSANELGASRKGAHKGSWTEEVRGKAISLVVLAVFALIAPAALKVILPIPETNRNGQYTEEQVGQQVIAALENTLSMTTSSAHMVTSDLMRMEVDRWSVVPDGWIEVFMVIPGSVDAGWDQLQGLDPDDISITGLEDGWERIEINLPSPCITHVQLDYGRFVIWADEQMWIGTSDAVNSMIAEIEQDAVSKLAEAAVEAGLLESTKQHCYAQVSSLLYGLGYQEVGISFHSERVDSKPHTIALAANAKEELR